jgi:hypothetical protein
MHPIMNGMKELADKTTGIDLTLKSQMRVVYLDQNAASLLAKAGTGAIWREIRDVLAIGLHDRQIVCPLPFEGIFESAALPLHIRRTVQDFFWRVSGGWAFKEFTEMSSELTLALVRPNPSWCPWLRWLPIWAEMDTTAQKISSDWRAAKVRMMARMDSFVDSPNLRKMSKSQLFRAVSAQRSMRIYGDLEFLLNGDINSPSIMHPWLVQYLKSQNISPAEIEALGRAIKYHGWATIQIHALDMLLGTQWEYDSLRGGAARYEANDEIDRKRAAMALNYADLFITEGGMTDLCRRAKINDYSTTIVVSVRDPENILEVVRSLAIPRSPEEDSGHKLSE